MPKAYRIRSLAAAAAISVSVLALLQAQPISVAMAQTNCPNGDGYRYAKHLGPLGTGTCFVDEKLASFAGYSFKELESSLRLARMAPSEGGRKEANDNAAKQIERLEKKLKDLAVDDLDKHALALVIETAKALRMVKGPDDRWHSFKDEESASMGDSVISRTDKSDRNSVLRTISRLKKARDAKDSSVRATDDATRRSAANRAARKAADSRVFSQWVADLEAYEAAKFPMPTVTVIDGLLRTASLPFMRDHERANEILGNARPATASCNQKDLLKAYDSAAIWVENYIKMVQSRLATWDDDPVRFEERVALLFDLRNHLEIAGQIEAILEEFDDQKFEKRFAPLLAKANAELQSALAEAPKSTRAATLLGGLEYGYAQLTQTKDGTRKLRAKQRCGKKALSDHWEHEAKKE
jgi:hypothetical protein